MNTELIKNKVMTYLVIIIEDETMTDLEKGLMTGILHNSFMDFLKNKDKIYQKMPSGE